MKTKFSALFVALLTTTSLFAYDFQSGDLYYNITGNATVEVTYQSQNDRGNYKGLTSVNIPASVTYNDNEYSVTSIGESAFLFCNDLTFVTIPNSIMSIGSSAFNCCINLTSINIPNGVMSIKYSTFHSCWGLTSIIIPNSVTSISNYAFSDCHNLTSITIPNSVISIGDGAFDSCIGLTSIVVESGNINYDSRDNCNAIIETATNTLIQGCKTTVIPNSVTSIGDDAFYGCEDLTSITIPNSVMSIGSGAFNICRNLISIVVESGNTIYDSRDNCNAIIETATNTLIRGCNTTVIPNSVVSIRDGAFDYCNDLTTVTIPDGVTSIGNRAFLCCTSLTSITIPNSITSIGRATFYYCSGLTSVTIGNSVTSIGDAAFFGCRGLTSVTIPNSVTSIERDAFAGCTALTSVTIPENVTSIGSKVFRDCNSLTSVVWNAKKCEGWSRSDNAPFYDIASQITSFTFGDNVESIPDAICENMHLSSVIIPNSVTTINNSAFKGCAGLTSVTIPESVTSIEDKAFYDCSSLSAVVPDNVTSIKDSTFYNVLNVKYNGTATGSPWGAKCVNGYVDGYFVYADETKTNLLACSSAAMGVVTVPESVTSIGAGAFRGCTGLTSIIVPENITSMGANVFTGCSSLTSVVWNAKECSGWGRWVEAPFYDIASQITSFTFGEQVESIPYAICENMHLNTVTIPNSVTKISSSAFWGCTGLASITIPENVTTIGSYAFENCTDLTSVIIPDNVTSMGTYTFSGCTNLVSASLGKGITSIDYKMFYDCTSLTSVIVPNSITTIGKLAFYNCSSLASITVPEKVTSIGSGAFEGCTNLTSVLWDVESYSDFATMKTAPFYDSHSSITSFTIGEHTKTLPANLCNGFDNLTSLSIPNMLQTIRDSTFANCTKLREVSFGTGLQTIGKDAFAGCRKLYNIYSFASEPPVADASSFANYNATLHVPCDYFDEYKYDMVFGEFRYMECISAESVSADDVTVQPSVSDAVFTWPSLGSADTYMLQITKDGEVFCTLTFNANGQLTGIAFAPAHNRGNMPAAALTADGYRFTITGLTGSTHYAYNLTVKDASENILQTYQGTFTTQSNTSTSLKDMDSTNENMQKYLRNGQLYIRHGDKTYTSAGIEL